MKYGIVVSAGTAVKEWDNTISGFTDGRVTGTMTSGDTQD
jgi:hypothetical protein